ncbi:MAG: Spy/CpxP family protein refolding chaperone [Deltaproteobacteria bacterium]|nr:Spy/CpxP family protein refolding chaperone [Deltaproteobacteria bacterium]
MIFKGVLIAVGVLFIVRRIAWRVRTGRWGGWHHHRHGHGHGHGGRSAWGWRGPGGFGGWRARGALGWLSHELSLDRQQRDLLEEMAHDLMRSGGDLRHGARRWLRDAVVQTAGDSFDRPALEAAAAARRDELAGATDRAIDRLERLQATLRPEQRARLAAWVERFWGGSAGLGGPPAPAPVGAGPYRI